MTIYFIFATFPSFKDIEKQIFEEYAGWLLRDLRVSEPFIVHLSNSSEEKEGSEEGRGEDNKYIQN